MFIHRTTCAVSLSAVSGRAAERAGGMRIRGSSHCASSLIALHLSGLLCTLRHACAVRPPATREVYHSLCGLAKRSSCSLPPCRLVSCGPLHLHVSRSCLGSFHLLLRLFLSPLCSSPPQRRPPHPHRPLTASAPAAALAAAHATARLTPPLPPPSCLRT